MTSHLPGDPGTGVVPRRMAAGERRQQVVTCALAVFAGKGYAATTTDHIARQAGLSQAYVLRLFGSKRDLFVATVRYAGGRIEKSLCSSEADGGGMAGRNRGRVHPLAERDSMILTLQAAAASTDPVIGEAARVSFGRIYRTLRHRVGLTTEEACDFLAAEMLCASLGALHVVGFDDVLPQ